MHPPKVGFISLGCPKALVDSERILTQLRIEGYEITPKYKGAGLIIVNTCGFIDAAKAESIATIGEALEENGRVIVTGCMGVRDDDISKIDDRVLSVSGPQAYEQVMAAVHEHLPYQAQHDPLQSLVPPQGIKLTPRHYAYLKISEGCNQTCSFCIIPSMRGRLVSRPIGDLLTEAQGLVNAGVKELLVISQDTGAYGVDTKYKMDFWNGQPIKTRIQELMVALGNMGVWVRLHYLYPYPHIDKLLPLMAENKIAPYLDIPFQHASPRILKLMKRPGDTDKILKRIAKWREICPDVCIRSTFIVGFPGETDEDFEMLLDFIEEAQLDRVGCFQYSPVDGADANELPSPVADEIKQQRFDQFMQLQQQISAAKLQNKIGSIQQVLIDEITDFGAIGRTYADAPEIDGQVHIETDLALNPGDMVSVRIAGADEYDLWGGIE
ncbi:MAG: 30S ribosomal protein S12 methylthiotransferase RimO [Pseudomonadales bacterium]|nr:30S ribosomal protein S12 methylthiotransferase RimO [Pseudomonadales bacterium]